MAFDDIYDLNQDIVARVSAGFGGGVGGMRHICGAVSGMVILDGILNYSSPSDKPMVCEHRVLLLRQR